MSLGPKVTVAANNVRDLKPAPKQEAPKAASDEKAAIVPHRVSREIGTLLVFVAGAIFGAVLAVSATTPLLDSYGKQLFQVFIAKHQWEQTTGQ